MKSVFKSPIGKGQNAQKIRSKCVARGRSLRERSTYIHLLRAFCSQWLSVSEDFEHTVLKKYSAWFMIFLVMTLPIISASAFASTTVTVTSAAGRDNTQDYLSESEDALNVEVEVVPDTSTDSFANFTENNVYASVFGKKEAFDSCIQSSNTYTCYYTSATADRSASQQTLSVSVYDDDMTVAASDSATLYIDGENPTITKASSPSYWTGDVNITFEAEDEACTSCSNACSGINRIELYFNNTVKDNISVNSEDCEYENILETSVVDLGISEGSQQLCVYVYDNVQNSAKKCSTITVDTVAPTISSSSFVIKDDNGNAIEHMGETAVHATVQVNITDAVTGIDTDSVYANLSALNDNLGEEYDIMDADCSEYENNVFVCAWDVYVDTAETAISVKVYAEDNAGNPAALTKTISFVEDATAPVVLSLTSVFNGYMNAKNNTLTLEIQEDGSGFDDTNAYLNLAELLLGNRQADSCAQSGAVWNCYWQFAVPSSVRHGQSVDISIATLKDDAGNSYDTASFDEETFIYDEEAPVFINATMYGVGREADVITEGDVVAIEVYIEEDVSGLDAQNVYADFSDFDDSNDMSPAQSCAEVSEDLWLCTWEYTGALTAGDSVELNFIATDNAGNAKDSDDDNVVAKKRVVGIVEGAVDYWDDYADVEDVPLLNPNFLYFTSGGTIVRLDTDLDPKGAASYIHAYQINQCMAGLWMPGNMTEMQWMDAGIVGQYYTADNKQSKYVLVNIPSFFYGKTNATVSENSFVQVFCTASVTQSRSQYTDIYSPNEDVNLSVSVPLMTGLYLEPSLATVDKIQRFEKFTNGLNKVTQFLGKWTEIGTKICGPASTVLALANNLVTILKGVNTLVDGVATPAVAAGVKVTNFLNNIWYGYYSKEQVESKGIDKDMVSQKEVGKTKTMENFYHGDSSKIFANPHQIASLGFLCDTVLCESCTETWDNILTLGKEDRISYGGYVGGEYMANILGGGLWPPHWNPRENIVVATICWPPCVTGIYNQLNIYTEILVAYNTCLNIATIKGEDIVQCDQFLSAQICQNVVNAFFWQWIWGLRTIVISKGVEVTINFVKESIVCPGNNVGASNPVDPTPVCEAWHIGMALITLGVTIPDTVNTISGLFKFGGNKSMTPEEEQEQLEQEIDEQIADQLGTTPY